VFHVRSRVALVQSPGLDEWDEKGVPLTVRQLIEPQDPEEFEQDQEALVEGETFEVGGPGEIEDGLMAELGGVSLDQGGERVAKHLAGKEHGAICGLRGTAADQRAAGPDDVEGNGGMPGALADFLKQSLGNSGTKICGDRRGRRRRFTDRFAAFADAIVDFREAQRFQALLVGLPEHREAHDFPRIGIERRG
jgi:hypothetical protein